MIPFTVRFAICPPPALRRKVIPQRPLGTMIFVAAAIFFLPKNLPLSLSAQFLASMMFLVPEYDDFF